MSYITDNLNERCTFWIPTPDGFGGYSYSNPKTINCRWEDKQVLYIDNSGHENTSQSIIYVDEDVPLESWIYLGESTSSSPPTTAKQVKSFSKTPDLNMTEYERKVIV